MHDEPTRQAHTVPITVRQIVESKEFALGVADVRLGRPPRFDARMHDTWEYERGRQFAMLAPMRMPLKIGHRANREAVAILARAMDEGTIL